MSSSGAGSTSSICPYTVFRTFPRDAQLLWEGGKPAHKMMSALEESCCCPTTPELYGWELSLPSQGWGSHSGPAVPPCQGRERAAVPESTQCLTPPLWSGANLHSPTCPSNIHPGQNSSWQEGAWQDTSPQQLPATHRVPPAPMSEPLARVECGREMTFPFSFVPCCVPGSKASRVSLFASSVPHKHT